jgi:glycosyltransferase involved in cell wall biosynthesis
VGYQRNVADWLAVADVSVLPSFYEGLPLAAIESQAAGRPVVATDVDGTPEVVVHGQTGLIVPPGDAAALTAAVCRLLGDPDERARLARAGRARVIALFDQRQQVRRTQDLYLAACRRMELAGPVGPGPRTSAVASRPRPHGPDA